MGGKDKQHDAAIVLPNLDEKIKFHALALSDKRQYLMDHLREGFTKLQQDPDFILAKKLASAPQSMDFNQIKEEVNGIKKLGGMIDKILKALLITDPQFSGEFNLRNPLYKDRSKFWKDWIDRQVPLLSFQRSLPLSRWIHDSPQEYLSQLASLNLDQQNDLIKFTCRGTLGLELEILPPLYQLASDPEKVVVVKDEVLQKKSVNWEDDSSVIVVAVNPEIFSSTTGEFTGQGLAAQDQKIYLSESTMIALILAFSTDETTQPDLKTRWDPYLSETYLRLDFRKDVIFLNRYPGITDHRDRNTWTSPNPYFDPTQPEGPNNYKRVPEDIAKVLKMIQARAH